MLVKQIVRRVNFWYVVVAALATISLFTFAQVAFAEGQCYGAYGDVIPCAEVTVTPTPTPKGEVKGVVDELPETGAGQSLFGYGVVSILGGLFVMNVLRLHQELTQ